MAQSAAMPGWRPGCSGTRSILAGGSGTGAAGSNRTRVRRSRLEAQVLDALGRDLMQPQAVAVFVAEFTAEWNRLQAGISAGSEGKRRELQTVNRKLDELFDAIEDGLRSPGLQARLDALEARKAT